MPVSSTKTKVSTIGGHYLGTVYDALARKTPAFARTYTSSESITGANHKGPPYRSGGPMFLARTRLTYKDSQGYLGSIAAGVLKNAYVGHFQVGYVPNAVPVPVRNNLSALGTEAISRTIPTAPSSSLAQYVAELRDLPGMIKQTQRFFGRLAETGTKLTNKNHTVGDALAFFNRPGDSAGDYLNLQFGWLPMLRDLQSFYKTGRNLDRRIRFLKANNNGKPVTRSRILEQWDYVVPNENYSSNTVAPVLWPVVHSFLYQPGTACSTRSRTVRQYGKIWFKATYRYYSPEVDEMSDWELARDALGLRLDPAVIYSVTPWTWLLDWFTTTGALVRNAVELSKHHVVVDHGYVMCHMSSTHDTVQEQLMRVGYGAGSGSPTETLRASASCLFETKQRVVSNPYGFSTSWDSLSGYQASILAALGISRKRY